MDSLSRREQVVVRARMLVPMTGHQTTPTVRSVTVTHHPGAAALQLLSASHSHSDDTTDLAGALLRWHRKALPQPDTANHMRKWCGSVHCMFNNFDTNKQ